MDTESEMDIPQIATILENGTYGQREMTTEEHTAYLEMIANAPIVPPRPADV